MVEQRYAEGVRRVLEPAGDLPILGAGVEAARGMVVRHHDRAGAVRDRIGEDLARVDDGPVDQADRYDPGGDELMGPVQ